MARLTCQLHRPGMTALHRVGLAGLYMTLDAFERDADIKAELNNSGLVWRLAECQVELEFAEGKERPAMEKLIALSFQLDHGFFKLPGLEKGALSRTESKWLFYKALLDTFLQFGPHRPTEAKDDLPIHIDDKTIIIKGFAKLKGYEHRDAAASFFSKEGELLDFLEVKSWLFPGGIKRHNSHSASCLVEPIELVFCLLFAPIGAIYFRVQSRQRGRKARTALVLPKVSNLAAYAKLRRSVAEKGVVELTASSPTDAALQLALIDKVQEKLGNNEISPIRVLAFGTLNWAEQQKARTAAYTVIPKLLPGMHNYETAFRIFKNRWIRIEATLDNKGKLKEEARDYVLSSAARELIADNIASHQNCPWYHNFADFMSHSEIRNALNYERKELFEMTQLAEYQHHRERIFIETCHAAWRAQIRQLYDRAEREQHGDIGRLIDSRRERLRSTLSRSKNAATLRATLMDFWSRAGSLSTLHDGWKEILPLLEEGEWRKARDLSLLALASYPTGKHEESFIDEEHNSNDLGEQL